MSDRRANAKLRELLVALDNATTEKDRKRLDKEITAMGTSGVIGIKSYWGIIYDHEAQKRKAAEVQS